ncbi:type IVB secretion system protein IcmH/DotU, partial [Glaciimonas soli]
ALILAARNPLYEAAKPILLTLAQLPEINLTSHTQIETFRRMMQAELTNFQMLGNKTTVDKGDVATVNFFLCTAIDEAVGLTSWGGGQHPGEVGPWASRSLAQTFHGDTLGGVKFFLLLGRFAADPADRIIFKHMLEVMYHLLSIGFEGQYRYHPDGQATLAELRQALYDIITAGRPSVPIVYSNVHVEHESKYAVLRRFPVWASALVMSLIVLGAFGWHKYQLVQMTDQVVNDITAVGNMTPPATSVPSPITTP